MWRVVASWSFVLWVLTMDGRLVFAITVLVMAIFLTYLYGGFRAVVTGIATIVVWIGLLSLNYGYSAKSKSTDRHMMYSIAEKIVRYMAKNDNLQSLKDIPDLLDAPDKCVINKRDEYFEEVCNIRDAKRYIELHRYDETYTVDHRRYKEIIIELDNQVTKTVMYIRFVRQDDQAYVLKELKSYPQGVSDMYYLKRRVWGVIWRDLYWWH